MCLSHQSIHISWELCRKASAQAHLPRTSSSGGGGRPQCLNKHSKRPKHITVENISTRSPRPSQLTLSQYPNPGNFQKFNLSPCHSTPSKPSLVLIAFRMDAKSPSRTFRNRLFSTHNGTSPVVLISRPMARFSFPPYVFP